MNLDNFKSRYPGLSENQLNFKYEVWRREREKERSLLESLKNRKNPFSYEDGDNDTGDYATSSIGGFSNGSGVVSDAPLAGSKITFIYPDGVTKGTFSDQKGRFDLPQDFSYGDIICQGGIDIVTGLEYKGELKIDAEFFLSYNSITPVTHIANHIWLNTPTIYPSQVLDLVVKFLPKAFGISLPDTNFSRLLNDDHVRLTMEGFPGAKELQALNTLIEVHSDIIGSTEANHYHEITDKKNKAIQRIGDAILVDLHNQSSRNYYEDIFTFHDVNVETKHKECCKYLVEKATSVISESLSLTDQDATIKMQALNLAVKSDWSNKALTMTLDQKASPNKIWDSIEKKNVDDFAGEISFHNL
jgi:hypothetical protein